MVQIAGDHYTTEQIWYVLHEPLAMFIRRRVADETAVEDILQEVFLKIHMHIETLRNGEKLQGWVYQIARNQIIDYYRRKTLNVTLEDAEVLLSVEEMPEEDMRTKLAPSIREMVNSLPAQYREALLLTDYEGLSQRELATQLGLSFSGAKSRVQRAREKLRQMLLDCCHFEFDRLGRVIDYQSRCECCKQRGCC